MLKRLLPTGNVHKILGLVMIASLISACSSGPSLVGQSKPSSGSRYSIKQDRGPTQHKDMSQVADAVPRVEAHSRGGNKSTYEVWGKQYHVMPSSIGFTQQGLASWYGEKFHGHLTSNGETYDMYAMTAAHKNLPLPTFARVTNLENGKVVIVRVNDRGPFHGDRIIDLSYAAASKLGYRKKGVAKVLVEAIDASTWTASGEQALRRQRQQNGIQPGQQVASAPKATAVKPAPKAVAVAKLPLVSTAQASATPVAASAISQQLQRIPGYYIQVGAFSKSASATSLADKLGKQLARADVLAEKSADGSLYRVIIGPINDRNSAELLGQKVVDLGFLNPLLLLP